MYVYMYIPYFAWATCTSDRSTSNYMNCNRARIYGWQNTYAFTKAMGEMLINSKREKLPVVIVRPSIIESTYNEPFPGWIKGNRF